MTASHEVTIRTEHDETDVVAAALIPDNTAEMDTRVEGSSIVTTIERDSTGGLRTTADDYVTNLTVAQTITDTTTQS
ncbi:KEOPS complex Pcc1-like subunit [Natronomonas halophila]|uniref:KEOPS complex subunit Pcc1 n=1 Tax=Natronomonas halophila TaxID=2747817 RepID=UPI0015B503AD|nr:KEOPS complex subunit Pcc1 [Natronomonas halophila]QLD85071.1 KEOPS complex Pcc1-like subunit [Natronomonas halophila]